jgi:hypothetical protein
MSDQSDQQAAEDFKDILALKRMPEFNRYLIRRLAEKRDEQAKRVLEGKFDAQNLLMEQRIYREMKAIAALVDSDLEACRKRLGERPDLAV